MAKKTSEKPEVKGSKKTTPVSTAPSEPKKDKKKKNLLSAVFMPFKATGRYLKGSWKELRQVFWPGRRATWGLTLAVILFTLFFSVLIVALDSGFQELFKRILL